MSIPRADAAQLLRRAGYGGTPSQIDALASLDVATAVETVLNVSAAPPAVPPPEVGNPALDSYLQFVALHTWWVERMRLSTRPLQEKMTQFWQGHFASSLDKVGIVSAFGGCMSITEPSTRRSRRGSRTHLSSPPASNGSVSATLAAGRASCCQLSWWLFRSIRFWVGPFGRCSSPAAWGCSRSSPPLPMRRSGSVSRRDGAFGHAMQWPGLALQRLSTREPDDQQVDVALAALRLAAQAETTV